MNEVKLTEKQEIVKEVIAKFEEKIEKLSPYDYNTWEFRKLIKSMKKEYGLIPKYQTLREYINENSRGAYHDFIFTIKGISINVCSVSDFQKTFNGVLLDKFLVVEDKQSDNGGNCENYTCYHHLTLELKQD